MKPRIDPKKSIPVTCPDCGEQLVKAWIEHDDDSGWFCGWLCGCKMEPGKEILR